MIELPAMEETRPLPKEGAMGCAVLRVRKNKAVQIANPITAVKQQIVFEE
jgi:hypothetical protein